MSRVTAWNDANDDMNKKIDGLSLEQKDAVLKMFNLVEINKSLALIADNLTKIAKEQNLQTLEMKRRK